MKAVVDQSAENFPYFEITGNVFTASLELGEVVQVIRAKKIIDCDGD